MKNQAKKNQPREKSGFQPLPFFVAMAAILPLQTGSFEVTRTIHLPMMEMQAKQKVNHTRRPASLIQNQSDTKKLIGNISQFDLGAELPAKKDWQIDGTTIDLLRFKPDTSTEVTVLDASSNELSE